MHVFVLTGFILWKLLFACITLEEISVLFFILLSTKVPKSNPRSHLKPLGDTVTQSIERATPGEEFPGLIRAVTARSPLVGSVSV